MDTVLLLGFLRCTHCPGLLVLGTFWTTTSQDFVPSDAPFRLEVPRNTRNPPFEDYYEDNGVENAPNITVIVHVSDWTLEVSIPHVKYVVTSHVTLVIPPTVTLSRRSGR